MSRRYCLALDLKGDPQLFADFEAHHRQVWPEILGSIGSAGILSMDIYRLHTRLMTVMEVTDDFSFERKAAADQADPTVQAWESLMWTFSKRSRAARQAPSGNSWRGSSSCADLTSDLVQP